MTVCTKISKSRPSFGKPTPWTLKSHALRKAADHLLGQQRKMEQELTQLRNKLIKLIFNLMCKTRFWYCFLMILTKASRNITVTKLNFFIYKA